ncbi:MAG: hypothetical protein JRI68_23450 [Deltaproteobacteria bacterium]|nr:hypothetical protein [Deltaproteobacteria bacterium]
MPGLDRFHGLGAAALGWAIGACGAPAAGPPPDLTPRPATVATATGSALDLDFEPEAPAADEHAADAARAIELQWVLAAHDNRDPHRTPKGDHVVYRSTRGGDMAVYLGPVDRPEIAPRRLWPCPRGCDLLGVTGDGDWVGLRLGSPAAADGSVVALRIRGGAPELDESPDRLEGLTKNGGSAGEGTTTVGPCGAALPGAAPALQAELGSIGVLHGSTSALTWQSPLTPADLWRLDRQSSTLVPLRNETRPGLAALGDVRLTVDRAAALMALVPRKPARAVLVVTGRSPNPVAAWDPVARALAGQGYAVVRSCRAHSSAAAVLRWLDGQPFAAGHPRVVVNAGPEAGRAVRELVAGAGVQTAVEVPWWWGELDLARREQPVGAAPAPPTPSPPLDLADLGVIQGARVWFDAGRLGEPDRRLVAQLRRAGAQVHYLAEPPLDATRERPEQWRRALRLAALQRFLDGLFPPPQRQGGVD